MLKVTHHGAARIRYDRGVQLAAAYKSPGKGCYPHCLVETWANLPQNAIDNAVDRRQALTCARLLKPRRKTVQGVYIYGYDYLRLCVSANMQHHTEEKMHDKRLRHNDQ